MRFLIISFMIVATACSRVPSVQTEDTGTPDLRSKKDMSDRVDDLSPDLKIADADRDMRPDMKRRCICPDGTPCAGNTCVYGEFCDGEDTNGNTVIDEFCPGAFSLGTRFIATDGSGARITPSGSVSCPDDQIVTGFTFQIGQFGAAQFLEIRCSQIRAWTDGNTYRFEVSPETEPHSILFRNIAVVATFSGDCPAENVVSNFLVQGVAGFSFGFGMSCAEPLADPTFNLSFGPSSETIPCSAAAPCTPRDCGPDAFMTGIAWETPTLGATSAECAPIEF